MSKTTEHFDDKNFSEELGLSGVELSDLPEKLRTLFSTGGIITDNERKELLMRIPAAKQRIQART